MLDKIEACAEKAFSTGLDHLTVSYIWFCPHPFV
jgi:hypothetical protein